MKTIFQTQGYRYFPIEGNIHSEAVIIMLIFATLIYITGICNNGYITKRILCDIYSKYKLYNERTYMNIMSYIYNIYSETQIYIYTAKHIYIICYKNQTNHL